MTLRAEDLTFLRHLVRVQTGVVLGEEKAYLFESRLRTRTRAEGAESVEALLDRLRRSDEQALRGRLVEDILVAETQFFRDRHPFEAIDSQILDQLIEARRGQQRLHLWSAACSTGQEPYSLAILLREASHRLRGWTVQLVSSDYSESILARAREGRFSELETDRGLDAALREKYFRRSGGVWQVAPELRDSIEFRRINLIEDWPGLPRMDLVLLRNVLIYFDEPTKRSILQRMHDLLRPGGYLLLGATETTVGLGTRLEVQRIGRTVVYRRPA